MSKYEPTFGKSRKGPYVKRDKGFDHASDFLYDNPELGGMPDSRYRIGVEFEIGGAYENWGYGIYRKEGDRWKLFAAGGNLETAIWKAREKQRKEFEESDETKCHRCGKNRMAMHQVVDGERLPLCMECFAAT